MGAPASAERLAAPLAPTAQAREASAQRATRALGDPIPLELLAPAGGPDQLRAAVLFGADAVYLAGERFGMRARAANFPLAELPDAVAFAHHHGVRVHVACNILMGDQDLSELPAYLRAVQAAGADALIVSDLGALAVAREHAPFLELHVSTQASVSNARAALLWRELGARRIVCAREMSVAQIARMREQLPDDLELEAFAHGAMCMAVSGRCLISSHLNGRSGNKGACTQPCRWGYALEEEKRPGVHFPIEEDGHGTYLLNAQDLNMLAHLRELADAGVASVKVEGRNKKAFYVASVVAAYRRVLDGEPAAAVAPELDAVSHRPYGTGFYFGPAEQATGYDGYEQECLHAADVLGSAEGRLYVRCRNRFGEGDALEALAPGRPPAPVQVRELCWLPEAELPAEGWELPAQEGAPGALAARLAALEACAVPVANRTAGIYRFRLGEQGGDLPQGSFLRVRRFRRSARSQGAAAPQA